MLRTEPFLIACTSSVRSAERTTRNEWSHVEDRKCVRRLTRLILRQVEMAGKKRIRSIEKDRGQCLKWGVTFVEGREVTTNQDLDEVWRKEEAV